METEIQGALEAALESDGAPAEQRKQLKAAIGNAQEAKCGKPPPRGTVFNGGSQRESSLAALA